eukprot:337662-Rhodomonas_salina.2
MRSTGIDCEPAPAIIPEPPPAFGAEPPPAIVVDPPSAIVGGALGCSHLPARCWARATVSSARESEANSDPSPISAALFKLDPAPRPGPGNVALCSAKCQCEGSPGCCATLGCSAPTCL